MDTVYSIQYLHNMLVYTGLLKLIVGVLTTCHTQHTWDRSICIFLFNRTTLQVFVTYLTGALYVHPLWFYRHQHDNRVCSKLFVACQRWWFQWRFWFVNCAPSGEVHNYCTPHIIKQNYENFLIHRCNYILLSLVYCVWQVVKTPTINFKNPVYVALNRQFYLPSCCFLCTRYCSGNSSSGTGRERPGKISRQSLWVLWWKNSSGTGLSQTSSVIPCQYDSIDAPAP